MCLGTISFPVVKRTVAASSCNKSNPPTKPAAVPSPAAEDRNVESFKQCASEAFCIPRNSGVLPVTPYNPDTIATWVFPGSKDFRKYQFRICRTALFANTMVCLPTGLGKTFIAAVIMHNFYRWFKEGMVFFLAPTKPLVDQQFEAFTQIIGDFNPKHLAQLTGKHRKTQRRTMYESAHVLFMTPQTLANDLEGGVIQEARITCIVFDEAHRATGNYAYCRIIKHLEIANVGYRVVGLSATPGSDENSIQDVITNLCISKIEARDETDPDVKQYTYNRNIEIINIKKTAEIAAVERLVWQVTAIPQQFLLEHHLLPWTRQRIPNKMVVLDWQTRFKAHSDEYQNRYGNDMVFLTYTSFSCLIALVNGYGMLLTHGIDAFRCFCAKFEDSANRKKGRKLILESEAFKALKKYLGEISNAEVHPKLTRTRDVLHAYYAAQKEDSQLQTIIFTQFVDSAREICKYFEGDKQVSARLFIGQANGYTQKRQIQIINEFKAFGFNTLIATCIGEEGLDIGNVNLIVCYDCTGSPVRMIQRFGRTARKQDGRVVILLSEEEERKYCLVKKKGHEVYKLLKTYSETAILEEKRRARSRTGVGVRPQGYRFVFYDFNPRMIDGKIVPRPVYLSEKEGKIEAPQKAICVEDRVCGREGPEAEEAKVLEKGKSMSLSAVEEEKVPAAGLARGKEEDHITPEELLAILAAGDLDQESRQKKEREEELSSEDLARLFEELSASPEGGSRKKRQLGVEHGDCKRRKLDLSP